jgi:shikimate dehydrogenase
MRITGRTRLAGIMGWPVAHSRSPALHGFWLEEHAIDGAYLPLPVHPKHLLEALRALPILGFRGCNLTIPHKEAALEGLDRVESSARRIGAVNTVVVAEDGSLEGSNTDAFGFRQNLAECVPEWEPGRAPAVVLGAGGASRAVVAALLDLGVAEIRVVNRSRLRAQALCRDLGNGESAITAHGWEEAERLLGGAGILVNTTNLGMEGEPPLELDIRLLPRSAPVADLVYAPLETALLRAAREAGHKRVDGLGTLLHQGRPGFEAWFGVAVAVTPEQRAAVEKTFAAEP